MTRRLLLALGLWLALGGGAALAQGVHIPGPPVGPGVAAALAAGFSSGGGNVSTTAAHQTAGCGSGNGDQLLSSDCQAYLFADFLQMADADQSVLSRIKFVASGAMSGQAGIKWTIGSTSATDLMPLSGSSSSAMATLFAQYLNGGVVSATVASQGAGGYQNGDPVFAVIPAGYKCWYTPTFTLTVVAGSVTAVTPATNGTLGGSCATNPMPGTLQTTGGNGSGLTITPTWGWTDFQAALAGLTDNHGLGHWTAAGWENVGGADYAYFDLAAGTASFQVCPADGGRPSPATGCPTSANLALTLTSVAQDSGPFIATERLNAAVDPAFGDVEGGWFGESPAYAGAFAQTNTTVVNAGAIYVNAAIGATAAGTTCTTGSPCTMEITGEAGAIPGLPAHGGTFTAGRWRVVDGTSRESIATGAYLTNQTTAGSNTNLSVVGTIQAPGIASGDTLSIIDANNPIVDVVVSAATASGKAPVFSYGGKYIGLWGPGVGSNEAGDGSVSGYPGWPNFLGYLVNGSPFGVANLAGQGSGVAAALANTAGGAGGFALQGSAVTGGTCANQLVSAISTAGVPTCVSVVNADLTSGNFGNIVGTGALNAGSISPGFGAIANGSTITAGTTLAAAGQGSKFGGLNGSETAPTSTNTNQTYYVASSTNWAGSGVDASSGDIYFAVTNAGTSTIVPLIIKTSTGTALFGFAVDATGPVRDSHGYTVSGLPSAGTAGRRAYVTDAVACTFLASLTGGSSTTCPLFDNGSAWVGG